MDAYADQLARPIRDQLNSLGYYAVIVTDEPQLRGTFDPESKVNGYIEASDAFVALCTSDNRVPGGTAQNIIDEIGRARSHPSLREVVCVLKEADVRLPSNINPVWTSLDKDNPTSAFGAIRRQLDAWGVVPTIARTAASAPSVLPADFLESLFQGVGIGDHDQAQSRILGLFSKVGKDDQRRVARGIFEYFLSAPENGTDIHVVSSFLEACLRIDADLVEMHWVEQLCESAVVVHRMSAAMILWDLAESVPGVVPLDLVARLARPATEDWYVFAPAIGAIKQLSLTRRAALEVIVNLSRSLSADDRDAAVRAFADLAKVDAALVPLAPIRGLARDSDPSVAEAAQALLPIISAISDDDRRWKYGRFGL
jgi:hypothetical protein